MSLTEHKSSHKFLCIHNLINAGSQFQAFQKITTKIIESDIVVQEYFVRTVDTDSG